MSLEISGNTINGNISLSKWKSYSNFVEVADPANQTGGSSKLWVWSFSESWYGGGSWLQSENRYLGFFADSAQTSTNSSSSWTIKTNEDLRKYTEFYFAGDSSCSLNTSTYWSEQNQTHTFGIVNNGSGVALQSWGMNGSDNINDHSLSQNRGWYIRGKIVGNQLTLYFGGFDSTHESATITINGKLQIYINGYNYQAKLGSYTSITAALVK